VIHKRLLVGVGSCLLVAVTIFVMPAHSADTEEPIVLFSKMMPVFKHPRCFNCHGAVDTSTDGPGPTGVKHGGGDVTGMDCDSCHAAGWTLAPPHVSFVGKDTRQLCQMQAARVERKGPDEYTHHVTHDALIILAFAGLEGGADEDGIADPPRMSSDAFLAAAKMWLEESGGTCGGWEGTITQQESFSISEVRQASADTTVTDQRTAERTVKITLRDGQATGQVDVSGRTHLRTETRVIGPNGPCTGAWTLTTDFKGKSPGAATTRIKVAPDGSYTIKVVAPRETTRSTNNGVWTGNCGFPLPPDMEPDDQEFDWSAWTFTIDGQLPDPRDRKQLIGNTTKTVKDGDTVQVGNSNPVRVEAWFFKAHVGSATTDGKPIPFKVTTTWDLKLVE
jgi:hypothetical protein